MADETLIGDDGFPVPTPAIVPSAPPKKQGPEGNFFSQFLTGDEKAYGETGNTSRAADTATANFYAHTIVGAQEAKYQTEGPTYGPQDFGLDPRATLDADEQRYVQKQKIADAYRLYSESRLNENTEPVTPAQTAQIRNELYPKAQGLGDYAADFLGGMAGSMASPEGLYVPELRAAEALGMLVKPRTGLAGVAGRSFNTGVSMAAVQTATEPLVQAISMSAHLQQEFDPYSAMLAPVMGFAGGVALHGAGEALGGAVKSVTRKIAEGFRAQQLKSAYDGLAREFAAFEEPGRPPAPEPAKAPLFSLTDQVVETPPPEKLDTIITVNGKTQTIAGGHDPAGMAATANDALRGPQVADAAPAAEAAQSPSYKTGYEAAAAARDYKKLPDYAPDSIAPPAKDAPAGVFMFNAAELQTDAKAFQYKDNSDPRGVNKDLASVTKWDTAKANAAIVWERKDGTLFVVDGHQRTGLARRLVEGGKETNPQIPGVLYREIDGIAQADVRSIAAMKNISEGSGSALDGARVLRSHPELLDGSMSLSKGKARQSASLARLDDEAFRMVVNEVVPEHQAAVVGDLIPNDGPRQIAAMKAIARFKPSNPEQAAALVQRVAHSEMVKAEAGAQGSMFGDLESADSTAGEEMKIVGRAIAELKTDKSLFARVSANADRIEQAGSTIARDKVAGEAQDAEAFAKVIASNAYAPGPIREALKALAKDVHNGKTEVGKAAAELQAAVRREVDSHGLAGSGDSARDGGNGIRQGEQSPASGADTAAGPAYEPGADGKPQSIIPGAERAGQSELDRRAVAAGSNASLTGNAIQKDTSGLGLFAPDETQGTMFRNKTPGMPDRPGVAPSGEAPNAVQIKSLQKQSFALADALGVTLHTGRLETSKAAAQYNQKYGIARVRDIGDFYSVAHEMGHALEQKLPGDVPALIKAHASELKPLDYDPIRRDPREGYAELTALMMTNPVAAQKAAPGFVQAFRAMMAAKNPEMLKVLDASAKGYADYLAAPSGARIASQIVDGERYGWLGETIKAVKNEGLPHTIGEVMGKMYDAVIDQNAPVTRAVRELAKAIQENYGGKELVSIDPSRDPAKLMALFAQTKNGALMQMRWGVVPYRQMTAAGPSMYDAIAHAANGPSVLGMMNHETTADLSTYMVAKRASNLWDRHAAGDLENPPVAFSKEDAVAGMAELLAKNPRLEQSAMMVHEFTRNVLTKLRDSGIITKELHEKLGQDPFYVPLFRDRSDKPLEIGRSSSGGGTSDGPGAVDVIKRLRGSSRDIIDPIQGIMMSTFLAERTIRHNDIVSSLADLGARAGHFGEGVVEPVSAKELRGSQVNVGDMITAEARKRGGNPFDTELLAQSLVNVFGNDPIMGTAFKMDIASKRGEPIMFYKEAGEMRAIRFQHSSEGLALYDILSNVPTVGKDLFVDILAGYTKVLRVGIVTHPTFVLTNYIKDQLATGILRNDYIPFLSGIPKFWTQQGRDDARTAARMYAYLGGMSAGTATTGIVHAENFDISQLAKRSYLSSHISSLEGLAEITQITEAMTRNSVFSKQYAKSLAEGLSPIDAGIEAAYQSTDLMDFGRHGSQTLAIRAIDPFINPHVQGLNKAWRALAAPLYRKATGQIITVDDAKLAANAGWALGKFAALGPVLGALWAAWNWKNEAYQDATPDQKGQNLVFSIGDKEYRIPKPYELSLGFTAGEYAYAKWAGGDPRAARQFMTAAWDVLKPPDLLLSNPIIKTGAEIATGVSTFTGRPIVPEPLQKLAENQQYNEKTSGLARRVSDGSAVLANLMNSYSGGSAKPWSPMMVDAVIGNLTGTLGREVQMRSKILLDDQDAPEGRFEDAAFVKRFSIDPDKYSNTTQKYYEYAGQKTGDFLQAANTYGELIKNNHSARARDWLAGLSSEQKAYAILQESGTEEGKKSFNAEQQRLNPITRAQTALAQTGTLAREILNNTQTDTETGQQITLTPAKRRDLGDNIRHLGAMEMRNALVILKEPGYVGRPILDVKKQWDVINAMSPEIGAEIARRYATAKVLPTESVATVWPKAKSALLSGGSQADLSEFAFEAGYDGFEFGGEKTGKRGKKRAPIPGQQPISP